MDDLFLYNHIKQAIKQKKHFSKDADQGNFAENYCRRQMMKKKLNFSKSPHPNNKMKNLMKNFTHVETYVDLNQLLFSINLIRSKQIAEKQLQKVNEKQRVSRLSKLNNIMTKNINTPTPLSNFSNSHTPSGLNSHNFDPMSILKEKVRLGLNQMIKKKYQTQNNEIQQFVAALQQQSHLKNSLLQNNSSNYISYLNEELQRIQRDEEIDGEACPDNWKIFKQLNQTLNQKQLRRDEKRQYFKSTNLNSKQKKQQNQLLHKISTFLQIALQNQHKQKWATKQMRKFRSTHGSFRFKKNNDERSKFFLKGIDMQKQNKQVFQQKLQNPRNTPSRSSPKRTTLKQNSIFMRKINSEQRHIFGKKHIQKDNKLNITHLDGFTDNKSQEQIEQNQQKNKINKQSPFKIFDKVFQRNQIRNTAPVNINKNHNLMEEFDGLQCHKLQKKGSSFIVKKQYQLNKKRKNRQYNFISPQKKNIHKTLNLGSPNAVNLEDKSNNTCTDFFSAQSDNNNASAQDSSHPAPFISTKVSSTFEKTSLPSFKYKNLSQTFTFKKRNKRQQILNKLQTFIEEVNFQQKMSKMQNQYYDSAINHLHDLSKTAYKNYEPQTLAGVEEIKQLKKFVNNINPALKKNHSSKGSFKKSIR